MAALFAVDPVGLGGVVLRTAAGPARDAWLAQLAALLPAGAPVRRVPLHIHADRLLGGLDLAATLQAGRPVAQRGLLAEADGGVLLLAMAERLDAHTAASVAAAIDTRQVATERQGIAACSAARIGVVALDEGLADDEQVPACLRERLAFQLALPPRRAGRAGTAIDTNDSMDSNPDNGTDTPTDTPTDARKDARKDADALLLTRADVAAARARLPAVELGDGVIAALCATSLALGVESVRPVMLAGLAARALAALDSRSAASADDAALAAALVLAPRATQLPAAEAQRHDEEAADAGAEQPPPATAEQPRDTTAQQQQDTTAQQPQPADPPATPAASNAAQPDAPLQVPDGAVEDTVLQAALAALPPGMLARLALQQGGQQRRPVGGGAGAASHGKTRGRPIAARRGDPQGGARLSLIDTLRAAAPWQALRRREAMAGGTPAIPVPGGTLAFTVPGGAPAFAVPGGTPAFTAPGSTPAAAAPRILLRRDDFHVRRFQQRRDSLTVFVVDASGSSALHRLAEAKGAVELLLADCYVRRDSVAVIAFRGTSAELLLPPTRSLVRAKRALAGLPGGGGTPLAAGIACAQLLADAARRRGTTPTLVLLTDGRANIARDGTPGRARAGADALQAAQQLRADGHAALVLDTSPQPQQPARELAAAMGARYLPLPHADAPALSQAVRLAAPASR